ncbi:collagen alpha-1(I) chain [Ixodes scapularis]
MGTDSTGSTGTTPASTDSTGSTSTPTDSTGTTPTGTDSTGSTPTGTDSTGTTPADSTGTTPGGTDSTGSTGTDSTGSTGTPPTGTDSTGTTGPATDGTTEKDCDKTTKQPPSGGGRPAAVKEPNGKPSELSCPRTGFFRRPGNCNKFYRCVDFYMTGRNYVVYEFDCPEGLVFDERYSVCNWPEQAAPCEEGPPPPGQAPSGPEGGSQEGGSPGGPGQPGEPGEPGQPGGPASLEVKGHPEVKDSPEDRVDQESPVNLESLLPPLIQGFFRNPSDCHRFYRCVDLSSEGKGFVVYEFDCPAGLVFDERFSVCNWPDDAAPCDGGQDAPSTGGAPPAEQGETPSQPPSDGDTPSFPPSEGETPSSPPSGGDTPVYPPTEEETPSYPPSGGGTPSYPPTEGGQPSPQPNPEEPADQPAGDCEPRCSRTGYFRNPGDCNKFYRCVDFYQKGSYVIFHFDCPAGLVFDERYSVCNWPHDAPPCDSSGGEGGAGSCAPSRGPSPPSGPSEPQPGPQPQPQPRPPQPPMPPPRPADSSVCKRTGFFRDPADCHKFYRCVDPYQNGKLQAVHFDCPAGLVFDERYSVCNWAHDAPPCDGEPERPDQPSRPEPIETSTPCDKTTSSDEESTTAAMSTEATTAMESTTAAATTPAESTTAEESTTAAATTEAPMTTTPSRRQAKKLDDLICDRMGNFAFEGDCIHFYRCTSNKKQKAELFKCPDKYVFDPKIEFCRRKRKSFKCDKTPSEELMARLPANFMQSAIEAGPGFLWD